MPLRVTIAGAGLSGLYAAWRLTRRTDLDIRISILEKSDSMGGLSRSIDHKGLRFDIGSHRLHPSCRPEIYDDIKRLIGDDLIARPRNGRVYMLGCFFKFPLNLPDLLRHCPRPVMLHILKDLARRPAANRQENFQTFKDAMRSKVGETICNHFYFPFARKMWGLDPDQISAQQAVVRVKTSGVASLLIKLVCGLVKKPKGGSEYFYPKKGIGQIARAMANDLMQRGVQIHTMTRIDRITLKNECIHSVHGFHRKQDPFSIPTDLLFSTIPVSELTSLTFPNHKTDCDFGGAPLRFRPVLFLNLIFPTRRLTPYDAHYFPEEKYSFTRISEPKIYSDSSSPVDRTGLCVEIPCDPDHAAFSLKDGELTAWILKQLNTAGLRFSVIPTVMFTVYVPNAYPIYQLGYEGMLQRHLSRISAVKGIISFGRCGLFVHDNMHHAMAMAYDAADCIDPSGTWNAEKWKRCLDGFKQFVVED